MRTTHVQTLGALPCPPSPETLDRDRARLSVRTCTVSLKLLPVQIYNGMEMIGLPHCTSKPGLDGVTASGNFFPGSPHPRPQQGYLSHPSPHILPRTRHNWLASPRCRRRRRPALTSPFVRVLATCDHEANPGSQAVAILLPDNKTPFKLCKLSLFLHPTYRFPSRIL